MNWLLFILGHQKPDRKYKVNWKCTPMYEGVLDCQIK